MDSFSTDLPKPCQLWAIEHSISAYKCRLILKFCAFEMADGHSFL